MNKSRLKKKPSKSGFTITEVLIVLVVSAVIFSGVLPLMAKTTTTNKAAKLKLFAYESARDEIENMKGISVSSLTNHNFTVSSIPGATGTVTINNTVNGVVETDIAAVTSNVSWTFMGKNESIELNTYLYAK